jgi:hypothetical protein
MMFRRDFLGALAASTLLGQEKSVPHFAPKAKRIIFLTQSGGPSQIELFDHKPGLVKLAGMELPDSVRQGQRVTTMTANQKQLVMPAVTKFVRHGKSGTMLGEWLPHLGKVVDDVCFVKSMHTDQINHAPAMTQFLTGIKSPDGPAWGRGSATGLEVKTRTCRTTSSCCRKCCARATSRSMTTTGAAASCRHATRV